jgi:hypothetical protein
MPGVELEVFLFQLLTNANLPRTHRVLETVATKPRGFPEMCKWNAFTIDRGPGVWKDGNLRTGKNFPQYLRSD